MTLTIQALPIPNSNRYEARLLIGNTTLSSGQTSDNEFDALYIALNLADDWIKEQHEKQLRFEGQPKAVYVPTVEVKRYTRGGELIEVDDNAPGYVVDSIYKILESNREQIIVDPYQIERDALICLCKYDGVCCPIHDPTGARD